jgi:hypothetical protein
MKILIFSDTHGDEESYNKMIDQEKNIDQIYCLGDSGFSLDFLEKEKIISVKGNYPFAPKLPLDLSEKIQGFWFYFTHGHLYHVKFGLSRIINKADLLRADVLCFGHTHKPLLEEKDQLLIFNPGALSSRRSLHYPSYGLVHVNENQLIIQLIKLSNKELIKEIIKVKDES